MKHWTAVVCVSILAGCAGPRISVTDASSRRVEFLVENVWEGPVQNQDMDEWAASYCRQRGLPSRQTDAVWTGPARERVGYECGPMEQPSEPPPVQTVEQPPMPTPTVLHTVEQPPTPTPTVQHTPAPVAHLTTVKSASHSSKAVAWSKAKTAIEAWVLCLRFDGERKAKETTEAPQLIANQVVNACSKLEQAVHEPLKAIGVYSNGFEEDLHAQAMKNVGNMVMDVRMKTDEPGSRPTAF